MFKFFYHYSSLRNFYFFSEKLMPFLITIFLGLIIYSLYGALISAPADYQQGDSFRIIYVHVPSAWMSLLVYMAMGLSAVSVLVWRVKLAEITLSAIAPIGATFTLAALVTGSIWGKPMWGTWWVWDARLTSVALLFMMYLVIIFLKKTTTNIDFGEKIGLKKTSAQLIQNYNPDDLLGKQVAAVINFPPKQIGKMISEVLVLGFPNEERNPILIMPSQKVPNGGKLF